MISEIGNYITIVTISITIYLTYRNIRKPEYTFIGITLAFSTLFYGGLIDDFSIKIIKEHSNSLEPLMYKIAGVWGNHEGSILLWTWLLSLLGILLKREEQKQLLKYLNIIIIFFLIYTWLMSNPFEQSTEIVYDGRELNPILQDPILVIHPPILYVGYIMLTIPFIISCIKEEEHLKETHKRYIYISWLFLTLGITLGSWWAYHELGWGGYWFWDPVENVALLPWILCIIIIHNYSKEKKGATNSIRKYTILAYLLSIIGTFSVRSGILASVHSFATDKGRGLYLILYILIIVALLMREILRKERIIKERPFTIGWLIGLENIILLSILTIIIIGTYLPVVSQIIGKEVSIGEDFYNNKLKGLVVIMLIFMIISQNVRWEGVDKKEILKEGSFIVGGLAIITPLIIREEISIVGKVILLLSIALLISLIKNIRRMSPMILGHMGIALIIIGVIISNELEEGIMKTMKIGEVTRVGDYNITLGGIDEIEGETYSGIRGKYIISKEERVIGEIEPEKRYYKNKGMIIGKAEIKSNLMGDIFGTIGEGEREKGYMSKIQFKGMVMSIWGGALLLILSSIRKLRS